MNALFIESLDLKEHPLKKANKKIRTEYFSTLSYIVNEVAIQPEIKMYVSKRLEMYQEALFSDGDTSVPSQQPRLSDVCSFISKPWRKNFRYMLVCDISLILLDESLTIQAVSIINSCLSKQRQTDVSHVLSDLAGKNKIREKHFVVAPLIKQYRINKAFLSQPERRIIVTANMSAGKSTLINALIGKPLARTSQEACTGNLCYLFRKVFEDGNVHLSTESLTMSATANELHSYEWSKPVSIASYFAQSSPQIRRLCVIDTPGVNAALYKSHVDITRTALQNEDYDMVLYVVCPTNLGTDAEIKHLKWVAKNLPKEKVIFVLNKIDNYRDCSDSVEESVHELKDDLHQLGFEHPVVCPISAYFSYLLKLKMTGKKLSDDETDEYTYLSKKFMRPAYNMACYYDIQAEENESDEMKLSKRAGIYGLEKIIYGGKL